MLRTTYLNSCRNGVDIKSICPSNWPTQSEASSIIIRKWNHLMSNSPSTKFITEWNYHPYIERFLPPKWNYESIRPQINTRCKWPQRFICFPLQLTQFSYLNLKWWLFDANDSKKPISHSSTHQSQHVHPSKQSVELARPYTSNFQHPTHRTSK